MEDHFLRISWCTVDGEVINGLLSFLIAFLKQTGSQAVKTGVILYDCIC